MAATTLYEISHVSRYSYASPMRGCVMSLCLTPRDEPRQRLWSFELSTAPPSSMNPETDSFGNTKHLLNIHREHEALEIAALSTVETEASAQPSGPLGAGAWEEVRSWRDSFAYWDYTHSSALTRPSAALDDFVARMNLRAEGDPLEALTALSDALHSGFEYVPGSTSVVSPIDHILETGLGWTGFDPTNGRLSGESHVRVAVGRDYQDVAPTQGVLLGGGNSTLEVDVRMRPVESAPGDESV